MTCHRRFRNVFSAWRSSSARLWRGSPITCPRATSTRMCRAGGVQLVAAVAARPSRNWTARLATSFGIVRSAETTDGSMGGKTRPGIASTTRARRRRVRRRRPRIERRAGMRPHDDGIHLGRAPSSRHAGFAAAPSGSRKFHIAASVVRTLISAWRLAGSPMATAASVDSRDGPRRHRITSGCDSRSERDRSA